MAVDPSDFLDSAQQLIHGDEEIAWRNAVSRAYYGSYHEARQTIARMGWPEYASGPTHERLVALFIDQKQKPLAYRLKSLHRQRCAADYEIDSPVVKVSAEEHVSTAARLMADLSALKP